MPCLKISAYHAGAHFLTCPVQKQGDSLQQFTMMAGKSTGSSVKSRKLQQRNAILRRTGFIEGPACIKGVGGTFASSYLHHQHYIQFSSTGISTCHCMVCDLLTMLFCLLPVMKTACTSCKGVPALRSVCLSVSYGSWLVLIWLGLVWCMSQTRFLGS